jgi:hypothetical protein
MVGGTIFTFAETGAAQVKLAASSMLPFPDSAHRNLGKIVSGSAHKYPVKILRIALGLDQPLTPACGASDIVRVLRTCAIIGVDDFLGQNCRLVDGFVAVKTAKKPISSRLSSRPMSNLLVLGNQPFSEE